MAKTFSEHDHVADRVFDALIQQESGGRHRRDDGALTESKKGALGIAQIMPATAGDPGFGVSPLRDDSEAEGRRFGLEYLRAMAARYNGDEEAMLVAYNAGPGNADNFVKSGNDFSVLPVREETEPYVRNILSNAPNGKTGVASESNKEFFSNLINGQEKSDGGGIGTTTAMDIMENMGDFFDKDLNAEPIKSNLPSELNPVAAPDNLQETFGMGLRAGAAGLRSEGARANAALQTILGNEQAATNSLQLAEHLDFYSGREVQTITQFDAFMTAPTIESFLEQSAFTVGQVGPSAVLSIASLFAGAGAGLITRVGGKSLLNSVGRAQSRRLVRDIAAKKLRGEALDDSEQVLLANAYNYTRAAAQGIRDGALAGGFAAEFPLMSGSAVGEFVETDGDLSRADAVQSFLVGAPLAAVGVGGEALIAKSFIDAARKKAAGKTGSIWMDYARAVAKGTGQGALVEGTTEGIQEGGLAALRTAIDDTYTAEQAQLRVAQGVFAGFLAGGAIGGGGSAIASPISLLRTRMQRAAQNVQNPEEAETQRTFAESMQRAANYGIASLVVGAQKAAELIDQKLFSSQEALLKKAEMGLGDETLSTPTAQSDADLNAEFGDMYNPNSPRKAQWLSESMARPLGLERAGEIAEIPTGEAGGSIYAAWIGGQGVITSPDRSVVEGVLNSGADERSLADALGFYSTKPEDADTAVIVYNGDGDVVAEELTNAANASAVEAHHNQRGEGFRTERTSLEEAMVARRSRVEREVDDMAQSIKQVEDEVAQPNRFGEADRSNWEPVQEYAVNTDVQRDAKENQTRDDLLQELSNVLTEQEFEAIRDAASDISTGTIRAAHRIAFSEKVEGADGETRYIPRLVMEDGVAKLYREPLSVDANNARIEGELAEMRQQMQRVGRIPHNSFKGSLVRFVHATKGGGTRDVGPNITRLINMGVRMNWLTDTSLVSDFPLTHLQQRKQGLIRAVSELKTMGIDLQVKLDEDTFVPLDFSERQFREISGLAGQVMWIGEQDGRTRKYTLGQLVRAKDPETVSEAHLDFPTNPQTTFDIEDPSRESGVRTNSKGLRIVKGNREIDIEDQEARARVRKEERGAGRQSRQDLVTDDQRARIERRSQTGEQRSTKATDLGAYDASPDTVPTRLIDEQREGFVNEQREIKGNKSGVVKKQTKRVPDIIAGDVFNPMARRVMNVLKQLVVDPDTKYRIMSLTELKKGRSKYVTKDGSGVFTAGYRYGGGPTIEEQIDRMETSNLIGFRLRADDGRETFVFNDKAMQGLPKPEREAAIALVLGHEVGHVIFDQELERLRDNPKVMSALWESFKKDARNKADDVKQYTADENGFMEWYADKASAYAFEKSSDKQYGIKPDDRKQIWHEAMQKVGAAMRRVYRKINSLFFNRFDVDENFNEYMEGVRASVKERRAEFGPSIVEDVAMQDMIQGLNTPQNRARATRLNTIMQRVLNGRGSRWLKRHIYASDDFLRSLGPKGVELAQLFYGRSQSTEGMGFHERKSQAQNKWINKLADALDIPVNFNEKQLESGPIAEAFDQAADETIDTQNLPPKARKIREYFEDMYDNYLSKPNGGMWVNVKRRENYAPRTLDIAKINNDRDGFIKFLQQYMSIADAQGVVDSIFGPDPENDPVGYPAFGNAKGRKLTNIPTKDFIKSGYLLPSSVSSLNYIHQMTKRVEYNRLKMKSRTKALMAEIIDDNPEYKDLGLHLEKVVMGQYGRLSTFRGKEIADAKLMRAANSFGSAHTIVTTLTFAVFASFPDLGGIATRNKEWSALDNVIRNLTKSTSREEARALAASVGVATHDSLANMYMSAQELDDTYQTTQRIARFFFKWTGTEWYTSTMRNIATGVGKDFLIYNATHPDFDTDPKRQRYLDELGVTRKEVLDWHNDRNSDGTLKLSGAKFEKVAPAIARFANEAIIRPNPAQRPSWANNPWYTLLWHLKSYFYAYGKTVVGGLGREIKNRYNEAGAFSGAGAILVLAAGLMLPLTALGLFLRENIKWFAKWLLPGMEADGFTMQSRYMSTPEYTVEMIDRSGILGPFTLVRSTYEGLEREGIPAGIAISNIPALDAIDDSIFDGDYGRLVPVVNNL